MSKQYPYDCPQCGEPTERLHEGYCEPCRDENQQALDEHNARWHWWQSLTDAERSHAVSEAAKNVAGV